jgi:hypothetical protein
MSNMHTHPGQDLDVLHRKVIELFETSGCTESDDIAGTQPSASKRQKDQDTG